MLRIVNLPALGRRVRSASPSGSRSPRSAWRAEAACRAPCRAAGCARARERFGRMPPTAPGAIGSVSCGCVSRSLYLHKALQMEGIPYYELTHIGLIIASTIEETGDIRLRMKLLESYISNSTFNGRDNNVNNGNSATINDGILLLSRYAPSFILKIINEYIIAYNHGEIEKLDKLDGEKLKQIMSKQITIERELVEACMMLSNDKRELIRNFIKIIS